MTKRRAVKKKKAPPARAARVGRPRKDEAVENVELTFEEPAAPLPMQWVETQCPYCGEHMDIRVDPSEEGQVLVQDCAVCCKPVELAVEVDDGEITVAASRG